MNYTKVNQYKENIYSAINTIASQAVASISYDTTIVCTITDNQFRRDGKYTVTDGSSTFTAYSQVTDYSKNDNVYITIPNGNWDNQKMIVGKKVDNETKPFVYVAPFDTIFDLTDNLTPGVAITSLLANEDYDKPKGNLDEADTTLDLSDISAYFRYSNTPPIDGSLQVSGGNGITINLDDTKTYITSWEIDPTLTAGCTRLGVKADFKSWVTQAVEGHYGLNIYITATEKPVEGSETPSQILKDQKIEPLDCQDFYGNPYNFETYYNQEKVYDISKYNTITNIKVEFYQMGDFRDKEGEFIPYYNQDGLYEIGEDGKPNYSDEDKLFNNLFVDNLYICAGYDLGEYTNDFVEIYTADSPTFSKDNEQNNDGMGNRKDIKLRWVHVDDESDMQYDMTKYSAEGAGVEYDVCWYRYVIGAAAADEYCGVYWTTMPELSTFSNNGELTNGQCTFYPDVNNQLERIKVIILVDGIPYRSNILEFNNAEEVPNKSTIAYQNALEIVTDDGTNGNYLVYGQNGNLLDYDAQITDDIKAVVKKEITLSLEFDGDGDRSYDKVQDYNNVTWYLPYNNSMMKFIGLSDDQLQDDKLSYIVSGGQPKFTLAQHYDPGTNNNTVVAEYKNNNIVYRTEKEFTFGKAGTMGTSETIVVDFEGDQKFYVVGEKTATFVVRVYDATGREITDAASLSNITWSWKETPDSDKTIVNARTDNDPINMLVFSKINWTINDLRILQVQVGDLITYFPIPIQRAVSGDEVLYNYIVGATEVIYRSDGVPEYSRKTYGLYRGNTKENVTWRMVEQNGSINLDQYTAELSNTTSGYLKPVGMYIKDAAVYGIQALIGGTVIWTQPILVMQNKWPSNVINNWDGKTLKINNDEGYILSNAIAAGKKITKTSANGTSYNTFSGVMLGNCEVLDADKSLTEHTGVYGFHEGQMAYAFKDDGTAFIGKSGKGRIEFDGDDGFIQSGNFRLGKKENGLYPDLQGTKIDLTNGKIYTSDGYFSGTIYAGTGIIGGWKINSNYLNNTNNTVRLNSDKGLELYIGTTENYNNGPIYLYSDSDMSTLIGTVGRTYGARDEQTYGVGITARGEGVPLILEGQDNVRLSSWGYANEAKTIGHESILGSNYQIIDDKCFGAGIVVQGVLQDWNSNNASSLITMHAKQVNLDIKELWISRDGAIIDFSKVEKENQKGIYARFA